MARTTIAGGARYNTSYIQGVGIGTLTDKFRRHRNFSFGKENKFTLPELVTAMVIIFNGHLRLHHLVREKAPRYGNDDDAADKLMQRAFRSFHDEVTDRLQRPRWQLPCQHAAYHLPCVLRFRPRRQP